MRGLANGQSVHVLLSEEVAALVSEVSDTARKPVDLLAWLTVNSARSERLQCLQLSWQKLGHLWRHTALQQLLRSSMSHSTVEPGHSAAELSRFFSVPSRDNGVEHDDAQGGTGAGAGAGAGAGVGAAAGAGTSGGSASNALWLRSAITVFKEPLDWSVRCTVERVKPFVTQLKEAAAANASLITQADAPLVSELIAMAADVSRGSTATATTTPGGGDHSDADDAATSLSLGSTMVREADADVASLNLESEAVREQGVKLDARMERAAQVDDDDDGSGAFGLDSGMVQQQVTYTAQCLQRVRGV